MKTGSASQTKRTVLCSDIGSSSLKTALIDEKGSVLAYDRCRFNRNSPSSMWYDALCSSVARISRMTSLNSLAALSISGNGPTIAFLYESGLTDIVMWNDGRYQNRVLSYTGTSLFLPRIISYSNSIDHKEGKLVSLLSGPEYLVWQLCGEKTTLLPEKRYVPAYWTPEDIKQTNLSPSVFPPFVELGQKSGYVKEFVLKDLGITSSMKDIPVFCAGPDFTSALIGTKTLTPGTMCDRAGSSEGFNLCTERPLVSSGIRNLPSLLPGLYNASILIPDSGIRFSTGKKATSYAESSYEDYVFYLLNNRDEQGYKQMITLANQCNHAFSTLLSLYNKQKDRRLTVTGGQARNVLWLQIKATIMNTAIDIPSCTDAELLGNAASAFFGLKVFPDLLTASNSLFSIQKTLYPDGESYVL